MHYYYTFCRKHCTTVAKLDCANVNFFSLTLDLILFHTQIHWLTHLIFWSLHFAIVDMGFLRMTALVDWNIYILYDCVCRRVSVN